MSETKNEIFAPAHYVGMKLHRASETVQLQFATLENTSLLVTIPAKELGRLYAEIDRKLEKAPELDVRESKKA